MLELFDPLDVRPLLTGAAVAVSAGLLMGLAMQPNLRADDRPAGPQILAGISAPRADNLYDAQANLAAYRDRTPDYVVGSDWLRRERYEAETYDVEAAAVEPRQAAILTAEDAAAPAVDVGRSWIEEPTPPASYPSLSGNVPTASDLPPAPEPPAEDDPTMLEG